MKRRGIAVPAAAPDGMISTAASATGSGYRLTPREAAVLGLLARGGSYAEIALELGVSVHTVATHVKNLYRKLGVHSARAAARQALD